jgi:hypothetical protein
MKEQLFHQTLKDSPRDSHTLPPPFASSPVKVVAHLYPTMSNNWVRSGVGVVVYVMGIGLIGLLYLGWSEELHTRSLWWAAAVVVYTFALSTALLVTGRLMLAPEAAPPSSECSTSEGLCMSSYVTAGILELLNFILLYNHYTNYTPATLMEFSIFLPIYVAMVVLPLGSVWYAFLPWWGPIGDRVKLASVGIVSRIIASLPQAYRAVPTDPPIDIELLQQV